MNSVSGRKKAARCPRSPQGGYPGHPVLGAPGCELVRRGASRCQSRFSEFSPMRKAADNAKREVWTWPAGVDSFPPVAPGAVLQRKGTRALPAPFPAAIIRTATTPSPPIAADRKSGTAEGIASHFYRKMELTVL